MSVNKKTITAMVMLGCVAAATLVFAASPAPAGSSATGLTVGVTEGPYFVSGTGALKDGNLNYTGLPGTPIKISGRVYAGASGVQAIANAKIEIWQADDAGSYHPNGNGTASKYNASQIALRGYITSAADGSYTFSTVYPGYYEGRARHIHFKVTATGYKTVTSQLIFYPKAGDGITYSTDSIAQSLPAYQLLKLDESSKPYSGTFDIRLSK